MSETLLLLEDDEVFSRVLSRSLEQRGYRVISASTLIELDEYLGSREIDYFVLDLKIDDQSSMPYIQKIRNLFSGAKILVLTGYASIATSVEAIKNGADNYLPKPANADDIVAALAGDVETNSIDRNVMTVDQVEWEHIQRVLFENEGNVSKTAKQLNMHRRTLQRKLNKKSPLRSV